MVIRGEEARHMRTVLRLGRGDHFKAFDDEGNVYLMRIVEETSREILARVVLKEGKRPEPAVRVFLGVGIPKGDRFDYVLQKATELGVWEIVPFVSSRVQVKIPKERAKAKLERWKRIVLEAVKQCGNTNVPEIPGIYTYSQALEHMRECDLKVILFERTFAFTLKKVLSGVEVPRSAALLVGPEGGFSEDEVERAEEFGFVRAGLGRNVLRVETAAVAALAMVQYHFDNL